MEQQGRDVEELNELWDPTFWSDLAGQIDEWDSAIEAFNRDTGVSYA